MTAPACLFCGQPEHVSVFEVFSDHSFMVETCCDDLHDELCAQDPEEWTALLRRLQIDALTGHRLRRVVPDDGMGLTLDYQLAIRPVRLVEAKAFVRRHHAHCPAPPAGWRFGAAIHNGNSRIGVVMVGRPVARMLDHTTTVEVNRLCIRRDLPPGLVWNAASLAYGWAARTAKQRGFRRIVTYVLESETGGSLVAAGWNRESASKGGSWSRPSRPRTDKAPVCAKVRWGKQLRRVAAK